MEKQVCICGAGTMGSGIALAIAGQGIRTILYDLDPAMISKARTATEKELKKELDKKRITAAEVENTRDHILFSTSLTDCVAPLIIEAIVEKTEAKTELLLSLSKNNGDETVFATNTSSLSITAIAEHTPFPERIVGLHFFNPANRMKLVEIIRTKYISEALVTRMTDFAKQLGKTPVICMDAPGFIVNHVARPFYIEALRLAEEQVADFATIDRLMESAGFKMGPFHLMDLIGNDINYTVSSSVYEALGLPPRLKPSSLQEGNVKKGLLGIKTGSGFFTYPKPAAE